MSYGSDFDRFSELRRIQQKEYERTIEEIVERFSKNPIPSAQYIQIEARWKEKHQDQN